MLIFVKEKIWALVFWFLQMSFLYRDIVCLSFTHWSSFWPLKMFRISLLPFTHTMLLNIWRYAIKHFSLQVKCSTLSRHLCKYGFGDPCPTHCSLLLLQTKHVDGWCYSIVFLFGTTESCWLILSPYLLKPLTFSPQITINHSLFQPELLYLIVELNWDMWNLNENFKCHVSAIQKCSHPIESTVS